MKNHPIFRVISLMLCVLLLPAAPARAADNRLPPQQPEQSQPLPLTSIKTPTWKFTSIFENTRDLRAFGMEAQRQAVADIERALGGAGGPGGENFQKLGEIFQKRPFAELQLIAKGDKHMTADTSVRVAELRRAAAQKAMAMALEAVDPGKKLTIGMLDSGNKSSGIKSDMDQTIFVLPREYAQETGVTEARVIAEFNKQFQALTGVHPERAGISSMNGADFYPDWRQKQTVGEFSEDAGRVAGEKRKDTGAYRSEGELKSQAEGRGFEALQEHHRRVRELKMMRDRVDRGGGDPGALAAMEKEVAKNSPWTEVGWDEQKKTRVNRLEDPKNRVLVNEPERVRRFAYDGTWDNWLMSEHHPDDRLKYLRRHFSEGASLLRKQVMPNRAMPFEYERFFADGRRDLCDRVMNDVYASVPPEKVQRFRKAMDAASRDWMRHTGKNGPGGKPFTDKEIWQEYRPVLSEKEAGLYEGMGREAVDAMLQDRAKRAWEADAREMMIETLVRTAKAPAELLRSGITPAEMNKIRRVYPNATPEKLDAAVRKQFYQSFVDLLSIEHAKALTAPPDMIGKAAGRPKDLVDRVLEKFNGDPALKAQILEIARDAAARRVATEPGLKDFRVGKLYEHLNTLIKAKWNSAAVEYRKAKADYDSGVYTKEFVADKLMHAYADRWGSLKAQIADHFGFDVTNVHLLIPESGGMPKVEIEYGKKAFDGKKLLSNMASIGNLDSVMMVVAGYQQGGASAAAWAAAYELFSVSPGGAHLIALRELVVNRRPQGVIMMGAAMFIPGLGQAYTLVSLASTSVAILGNMVLQPLKDDDADKMYQGFLDKRSGFRDIQRSQRPGLLHGVPLRVITFPVVTPDGKTTSRSVSQAYSRDEADKRFYLWPGEYDKLTLEGILGGGPEWDAKLAEAGDEVNHAPEHFEAQRASVYPYYRAKLGDNLGLPGGLEPDEEAAFPHLVDMFLARIDDWINAKGEFTGYDENVIISRRFEDADLRKKIAVRGAMDLVRSYQMVKSIEESIKSQVEQKREEKMRGETNGMILATDRANMLQPDPQMAEAVYMAVDERSDEAREKAPRIHVYPRVREEEAAEASATTAPGVQPAAVTPQAQTGPPEGETKEIVDFVVSVLADPKEHPPVANESDQALYYHIVVLWQLIALNRTEKKVSATVQVLDKNDKEIATEKDIPIGIMGKAETPKANPTIVLVNDANYEKLPLFPETRPYFLQLGEPKNLLELPPFKENPSLANRVYGFRFYRRFDEPQPDEDLRFSAGLYSDTTFPLPSDPNPLVKLSEKDKTERVATFVINKPYVSFDDAGATTSRPWDPANPLPPRWYSYSVLMFNQNPKVINGTEIRSLKTDPKEYQEGPQAPWVRCDVEPVIAWNLYDPKTRVLLDPGKDNFVRLGSGTLGLNIAAVVMLDGERVAQEYPPDYQDVTPDRRRKYIYKVDFGDHSRYAICADFLEQHKSDGFIQNYPFYAPGLYKAVVSIEVDGKILSAPLTMEVTNDNWASTVSYNQRAINEQTAEANRLIAFLRSHGPGERGSQLDSICGTLGNLVDAYTRLGMFQSAEQAAQQALYYAQQAVAMGSGSGLWYNYGRLAKVYLAWGKPQQYLAARNAELQVYPRDKNDVWGLYQSIALEYLSLSGDIPLCRQYYEYAIQFYPDKSKGGLNLPEQLKP